LHLHQGCETRLFFAKFWAHPSDCGQSIRCSVRCSQRITLRARNIIRRRIFHREWRSGGRSLARRSLAKAQPKAPLTSYGVCDGKFDSIGDRIQSDWRMII
jgi:hypothetical protein